MATTPRTYTGEDATIKISGLGQASFAIGDFSLTIDRGTVEKELVGEAGNKFTQGALSVEGSFTQAEFGDKAVNAIVGSLINGTMVSVSGTSGVDSLHWYLKSCQITNFELSFGDASTVTEGSIDFTLLDPYNLTKTFYHGGGSGMRIYD